jgi:hypothetical protein
MIICLAKAFQMIFSKGFRFGLKLATNQSSKTTLPEIISSSFIQIPYFYLCLLKGMIWFITRVIKLSNNLDQLFLSKMM